MPNTDFDEFKFNRAWLEGPRAPGISAYMRVKDEQQLVRVAVMSHLEHYDEIIACYNDCTDDTPRILHELAAAYPRKIKVFHYRPKVHPPRSAEHARTPDDSVHGLANYYNWALAQTTRQVAVKLDADHLGISHKLSTLTARIRRDLAAGRRKLYVSSGINLLRQSADAGGALGVRVNFLLAGNGDFVYHPVDARAVYRNAPKWETFDSLYRLPLEVEYTGITFFHLRALKLSHHHRPPVPPPDDAPDLNAIISYDEFRDANYQQQLRARGPAQLNWRGRMRYRLAANAALRKLKHRLTGRPASLLYEQLARLESDLADIDFNRDVLEPLARWEGDATPPRHAGKPAPAVF